ncbi:MAG: hypothetical protein WD027_08125 [Gaiellales bacterium]
MDRPLVVGLVLAGLVVAAMGVRVLLTRGSAAPWIMIDELIYSEFAKSIADGGGWMNREQPAPFLSLYPALISPAWLAGSMETTFGIAKAINAVLMTLGAVPVFFWARRLVPLPYALTAALLVLLLPAFVMTGLLMTENAFFPAFLLALFAIAVALERPTLLRQGAALGALALALGMRYQALVLLAILPSAIFIRAVLEVLARREAPHPLRLFGRELLRFWPLLGALGAGAVGYGLLKLVQGQPLASGLSAYRGVAEVSYSAEAVLRWTLLNFGELMLVVAVAPFSALILLLFLSLGRKFPTSPAERAFLAVAAPAVLWVVVQAGFFASYFALRIVERNMFHVAPLCFVALVLWLARGAPRPLIATTAAVLAPLGLIAYLAVENPLGLFVLSDAFSLISVVELGEEVGGSWQWWVVGAGAALLAAAFVALPKRMLPLILAPAVAGGLLSMSVVTYQRLTLHSELVRGVPVVGDEVSWVDRALGRDARVGFLFTSSVDPQALWQTEFWNRSIGPVFNLGIREPGHLPETFTSIDPGTGELVPFPGLPTAAGSADADYILTPRNHSVRGTIAAQRGPWTVYLVDPPLRLAETTDGIGSDGWMGADASYTNFAETDGAGRVGVRLSRFAWLGEDVPGRIRIRIGELGLDSSGAASIQRVTDTKTGVIHSGGEETFLLDTPQSAFRVEIHIEPTFSPSDFGFDDPRELGAVVAFQFFPA